MSYLQKLGLLCMNTEAAIVFGNFSIYFPKSLLQWKLWCFEVLHKSIAQILSPVQSIMRSSSVRANFRVVLSEFIFTGLHPNTTEVNDKFSVSNSGFGTQSLKIKSLQKSRFISGSHCLAYYGVGIDVREGGKNEEHFSSINLNYKGPKIVSIEAKNKNYTDFGRSTNWSSWRKCTDFSFLINKLKSLDTRFWNNYLHIFYLKPNVQDWCAVGIFFFLFPNSLLYSIFYPSVLEWFRTFSQMSVQTMSVAVIAAYCLGSKPAAYEAQCCCASMLCKILQL